MDALLFVNLSTARARSGARVAQPGGRVRFLCRSDRCLRRQRRNTRLLRARLRRIDRENGVCRSGCRSWRKNERSLGGATHLRQMVGRDLHNRTNGQLLIKRRDVGRFHSNTTVAGRPPDRFLLRRSVNVNAPVIGVRVCSFQPAQPDDTGNDRIAARRVRLQNFAGEPAVVENRAGRSAVTDFLQPEECQAVSPSSPIYRRVRIWK